jgi:hypothetical protein
MDESCRLVELANARLKGGRFRVRLELQGLGQWLYVRGTFPPRPDSKRNGNYQSRIALGLQALDKKSVDQALDTAIQIALDLNRGAFDWRKFSDYEDTSIRTAHDWAVEWEKVWWRGKDKTDHSHLNTWRVYRGCLESLPNGEIRLEALLDWVEKHSQPGKRRRGHYCTCAKGLAQLAGLPVDEIQSLDGGYGIKPINPRDLPSDGAIANTRARIEDPGWQYVYGMMAAYGLRNHEVWFVDASEFPLIRVSEDTKTGARAVEPLYPEWAVQWHLNVTIVPKGIEVDPEIAIAFLGAKVTRAFKKLGLLLPYTYRHCYARRCAEFGIPPNVAARLMGHSTKMHEAVYQAWIGERVFLEAARKMIDSPDRPKPP